MPGQFAYSLLGRAYVLRLHWECNGPSENIDQLPFASSAVQDRKQRATSPIQCSYSVNGTRLILVRAQIRRGGGAWGGIYG